MTLSTSEIARAGFNADELESAVRSLWECANRSSGQSRRCAAFLLGLINGARWPFNFSELHGLDYELREAALTVLADVTLNGPYPILDALFPLALGFPVTDEMIDTLSSRHGIGKAATKGLR